MGRSGCLADGFEPEGGGVAGGQANRGPALWNGLVRVRVRARARVQG